MYYSHSWVPVHGHVHPRWALAGHSRRMRRQKLRGDWPPTPRSHWSYWWHNPLVWPSRLRGRKVCDCLWRERSRGERGARRRRGGPRGAWYAAVALQIGGSGSDRGRECQCRHDWNREDITHKFVLQLENNTHSTVNPFIWASIIFGDLNLHVFGDLLI